MKLAPSPPTPLAADAPRLPPSGRWQAMLATADPDRLLILALGLTLAFRFWLAATMPFTGDEAYYADMGRHPGWGVYDHPPMIAWWLALLLRFSDAIWWLRLPSTLLPPLLALAVRHGLPRIWPELDRERAAWAALTVALAPPNFWNVLITTDTPLVFFGVLSGLAWMAAARGDDRRWYLLSGVLLAGALLSKYFAFPLGFAYLVDAALRRRRRAWAGLAVTWACTVPALAWMAWWNAGHCWANVMFNFFTRTGDAALGVKGPLLYAASLAYTLTPPVLRRLPWRGLSGIPADSRTAALIALAPLGFFAALSLVKVIGLHWVLAFIVFAFLALARSLPMKTLRRTGTFFVACAAVHAAAFIAISRVPLETWRWSEWYDGIVYTADSARLADEMKPFRGRYVFASDNYSMAATLGYANRRTGGEPFIVFGEGSYHGRQDDIDTDFRVLDGRDILIFSKTASAGARYRPYFREMEVRPITWRGVRFWILLGHGFDYPRYRDTVLVRLRDWLYAIPPWLPQTGCYFCDRYFPGTQCAAGRRQSAISPAR